ncbi:MAG: aldehyde dehydrogenase (NADP(+)) [Brevibacterium sp.]
MTTGTSIIAGKNVVGTEGTTQAVNPATNEAFGPEFSFLSSSQVEEATDAAAEAFDSYRDSTPAVRSAFLDAIASEIESDAEEIISIAMQETGLPQARLTGEVSRTANQLRLFAEVVRQGDFNGVRIDPALPDRTPAPRVDIRQRQVALGPVAVFGASNFPLAFSTAGGDTASALAAGCPVVFKAHNAHPGTGALVAQAISRAVAASDVHPGVFSIVYGRGADIGQQLAADPRIAAIGFTGSRNAGLALLDTAAKRRTPIPVFAEMSAINPVFVLPGALDGDTQALAQGFLGSVTGSSGQLCTAPGLLFVPTGTAGDDFLAEVKQAFAGSVGQTMLTPGIAKSWSEGKETISGQSGVEEFVSGEPGADANAPEPTLLTTTVAEFSANQALGEEVFGAFSLVVRYENADELVAAVKAMEGQLTGTIQLGDSDESAARPLIRELELKVGRILIGGWPTGVEVGHAMVHGGPFPATTNGSTTSVGSLAIDRFLRPVAYQSFSESLLPAPLQDANPWSLNRRVDGTIEGLNK